MQIFSHQLHDRFRRKPLSTILYAVLLIAGAAVIGEFAIGFIDGMVAGFNDGI